MATRSSTSRPRRPRPERGSLRVQAWLYSVLWPLHREVSRALTHLERGDATWRHGPARLESLHDAAWHLSPAGREILDDLLASCDPAIRELLERYRRALTRLASAAAEGQRGLEDAIRHALRGLRAREPSPDAIAAVAADLVNLNLDGNGGVEDALLATLRPVLGELRVARAGFLDEPVGEALAAARALLDEITALRRALCDRYDLPPAPVLLHVHTSHQGS